MTLEEAQPDQIPDLEFEMTGMVKQVKHSDRPRSANDRLEGQKQHVRLQHKKDRPNSRHTNGDGNRGDGFNPEDEVKQVMTPKGLSVSISSRTVSGNSQDHISELSSTATKSKTRDRGGTSRSISHTPNGTYADDANMEDTKPVLPLRHKKDVISEPEQSEAGQAAGQPEDSDDDDDDMTPNPVGDHQFALLSSFCDVHGNQLFGQGIYISMNRTMARFEVLGRSSEAPVTVPFIKLLKYTTGTGGNGTACLLEGSGVQVESNGVMRPYWAGLNFRNHAGLLAFKHAVAAIGVSIKSASKTEYVMSKLRSARLLTCFRGSRSRLASRTRSLHRKLGAQSLRESVLSVIQPPPAIRRSSNLDCKGVSQDRPQSIAQVNLKSNSA